MLTTYFFPVQMAAASFPIIAFLATLPYAVYNYRKYGSVSLWRTVVLFSFAFYLLCAYYLVVLPLPEPSAVALYTSAQFDWVPFHFMFNIADSGFNIAAPSTWLPLIKSMEFLEPFFNIMLLMPFGVYLAYYFKQDWKKCLLFSFFLSFFFEMTQLSGLYGIYPRPYRLFSTDDLMLNSLGGMIGYFVYSKLLRFLPNKERIDLKAIEHGGSVGFSRRLAAFIVDGVIIIALQIAVDAFAPINFGATHFALLLSLVYSIGFALLTNGRTPGKALVKIKLAATGQKSVFALRLALRYILRGAALTSFLALIRVTVNEDKLLLLWLALFLLLAALTAADMFFSLRHDKRLWYERLSGTENVSTFRVKSADAGSKMNMGKKAVIVIILVIAAALIYSAAAWGRGYYIDRYVSSVYYAVIPLDYDVSPVTIIADGGEDMGLGVKFALTAYSADGEAKPVEFTVFDISGDFSHGEKTPPPGSYLRIEASKQIVTGWSVVEEESVPEGAADKLIQISN